MARFKRYFRSHQTVFVTLVTQDRTRWLAPDHAKSHLIECMRKTRGACPFRHLAHVILDDHLHWMVAPSAPVTASDIVSKLKRNMFHGRMKSGRPARGLWQSRFYDHVIRDERDFARHLDYVHFNPVKHGYVSSPEGYEWSSFAAWVERGVYEIGWGREEPDRLVGMDLE